jgi:putative flavoprotein involved in K+ transport
MRRVDTLVIGGGQAGLAMSRCLSDRGIDHVVLERRRIGHRWQHERWDSLRLLTPNWMTRLPGFRYDGPDPDGYMLATDVASLLETYAERSKAPVVANAAVTNVSAFDDRFVVQSEAGCWSARQVVVATGHCGYPHVPRMAASAAPRLHQLTPDRYRNPDQLPPGGVLVVGASATGVQLADELARAGRRVTVAVGQHTRVPRLYRGRDIFAWLETIGTLRESADRVHDVEASRAQPSLQLVGRPTHDTIDLRTLAARGVSVVGRLEALDVARAHFSDDLIATTAAADLKLALLLGRIDRAIGAHALEDPQPFVPLWPAFRAARAHSLDLGREGIATVIWATGFRRHYPWLRLPVLDRCGEIVHTGGATSVPGLFVLGLQFLRHRSSSFIDGVGVDAAYLAGRIAENLGHRGAAA